MTMPPHVRSVLEALLTGVSRKELATRVALMTDAYRSARSSAAAIADPEDALAYVVARMPATYAATWDALSKTMEQLPGLQPRTVLDLASGPGTASLAALEMWPAIERLTMLEGLPAFRDLAGKFMRTADATAPMQVEIVAADLRASAEIWPQADLVMAAYVPFEDEKFSYLAVTPSRMAAAEGARVIAPPRAGKGEIVLRTCTDHGIAERRISRRDRYDYKAAKRLGWGDFLRHNVGSLSKTP